ncbi:MAG: OmpA family protein [Reichenbachiella sp.]
MGQSVPKLRKIANKEFELDQYNEAIEFYEKIIALDKGDHQSKYNLAMCYYRTLQYNDARDTFLDLINADSKEYKHLSYYYYGTILKLSSQFVLADSIFGHLITQPNVADDLLDLTSKQKQGCLLALSHNTRENSFEIEEMEGLNSKLHDFGAIMNPKEKTMVFVTTRSLQSKQYEDIRYDGVLPDLVQFAKRNKNWNNISSKQHFDDLNTKWSEGSGSFTADGEIFYYTSCQTNDGADCKVMVSNLEDEKWSKPRALNDYINAEGFENKHPFISGGEDTLFFSSDREGGFGGSDIWMSLKGLDVDSWTPAINMGSIINTSSNEITPHFSAAYNCLMFASDGHVGYGGFDIFAAKGESFFEPEIYNLGSPFNSALDDTYFYVSDTLGFISSNRKDKKHLNMYSFSVDDERSYLARLISDESLIDHRIVAKYREIRSIDLTSFRVEDYQGFELFDPVKKDKAKPKLLQDYLDEVFGTGPTVSNEKSSDYQEGSQNGSSEINPERQLVVPNTLGNAFLNSLVKTDFENLYFDFGSKHLTHSGELSLNSLLKQLELSGQAQYIEIVSNTDDVGSEESNMKLSIERGAVIQGYLLSKGYPNEKIIITAMGESNPITSGTSWYDRLFNRRTIVNIYGDYALDLDRSKLIVLRQDMSLQQLSSVLGFSTTEVKAWNQLNSSALKKGDIIRVDKPLNGAGIQYFLEETDVRYNFLPYTVKANDTVESIARKFGNPEELLVELNQIKGTIKEGDELFVYKIK